MMNTIFRISTGWNETPKTDIHRRAPPCEKPRCGTYTSAVKRMPAIKSLPACFFQNVYGTRMQTKSRIAPPTKPSAICEIRIW